MSAGKSLDERISELEDIAQKLGDRDAEKDVRRLREEYQRLESKVSTIERDVGDSGDASGAIGR